MNSSIEYSIWGGDNVGGGGCRKKRGLSEELLSQKASFKLPIRVIYSIEKIPIPVFLYYVLFFN